MNEGVPIDIKVFELDDKFLKFAEIFKTFEKIVEKERNLLLKIISDDKEIRSALNELFKINNRMDTIEQDLDKIEAIKDNKEFMEDFNALKDTIKTLEKSYERIDVVDLIKERLDDFNEWKSEKNTFDNNLKATVNILEANLKKEADEMSNKFNSLEKTVDGINDKFTHFPTFEKLDSALVERLKPVDKQFAEIKAKQMDFEATFNAKTKIINERVEWFEEHIDNTSSDLHKKIDDDAIKKLGSLESQLADFDEKMRMVDQMSETIQKFESALQSIKTNKELDERVRQLELLLHGE